LCPWLGTGRIDPGDTITVRALMTDEGSRAYSCAGIETNPPLVGSSIIRVVRQPAFVQIGGQIPTSLMSGDVIHFTASLKGPHPSAGACADDLTTIEFDLVLLPSP
jgi:hypothetical protein